MDGKIRTVLILITALAIAPGIIGFAPNSNSSTALPVTKATNLGSFDLTGAEIAKLQENGFIVIPDQYKSIYQLYKQARQEEAPIFVTTDLVFHTAHLLFDYTLRFLEVEHLKNQLTDLTKAMLSATEEQYSSAQNARVKKAAKKNLTFFSVAMNLLTKADPPKEVKNIVNQELKLIRAHGGIAVSPLFGYKVDYSQYEPRGHYTRNDEFKRYFKTMIWYGKMMFRLKPGEKPPALRQGQNETLSALLIAVALKSNEDIFKAWESIYDTISFFAGEADNLQLRDYLNLQKEIYGKLTTIGELADDAKLDRFIDEASKIKEPKIKPTWAAEKQLPLQLSQGFCFIGQRFIPDSHIFQQLVYDKVGTRDNPRLLPKGLDVMNVLGSKEAEKILREEGDYDYQNYEAQVSKLKNEFDSKTEDEWAQNLYWQWLYSLKPLLEKKERGAFFIQNEAWLRKELNTALGSWTELRHDTVLYAKPSTTTSRSGSFTVTKGYVEPYSEVYERVAILARKLKEYLASRHLPDSALVNKLTSFEDLLAELKNISERELEDKPLTEEQYKTIWGIGDTLESLVKLPEAIRSKIISGEDEKLPLIVDVHTDPQTGMVLEEAVGYAFKILTVVKVEGEVKITEGGVLSHYEFKQPLSDRLTDAEWQTMLEEGKAPPLPEWTESFLPQPGLSLDFETIERGTRSGITNRLELVIKSENEWKDLWQEHISKLIPRPELPGVDFQQEMVIAVFSGEKPTGGYSIQITDVKKHNVLLTVSYIEKSPDPECGVIQVLTQPFHIIKVKQSGLPVIFVKNKKVVSCGEDDKT